MKIQYMSDLHMEFGGEIPPVDSDTDAVILAGDFMVYEEGEDWMEKLSKEWKRTIFYVLGNHEFYGSLHMPEIQVRIAQQCDAHGITLLDRNAVVREGILFVGATLWTDFELYGPPRKYQAMSTALQQVNDFGRITLDDQSRITPFVVNQIHDKDRAFIRENLYMANEENLKTVVITHYAPSEMSIHKRYKDSPLNPSFASNLHDLIKIYEPNFWIHGHVHSQFDYFVYNTRIMANPRGYPFEANPEFQSRAFHIDP